MNVFALIWGILMGVGLSVAYSEWYRYGAKNPVALLPPTGAYVGCAAAMPAVAAFIATFFEARYGGAPLLAHVAVAVKPVAIAAGVAALIGLVTIYYHGMRRAVRLMR